ncbi:MAG: RlpA-like double-psi beta-barrel domain-containing protein, partial [Aliarcobacter cryaerophilus]
MKLSNRIYSIAFLIFCSSFLFTGCSTKQTYDYSSYRKDTGDKSINNSEAMHRATMRPYNVFGIRYYPFVANVGDQFDGIASWYGPDFHAKKTSNGEIYNMYAMTAAHKTLPMNTVVRV